MYKEILILSFLSLRVFRNFNGVFFFKKKEILFLFYFVLFRIFEFFI